TSTLLMQIGSWPLPFALSTLSSAFLRHPYSTCVHTAATSCFRASTSTWPCRSWRRAGARSLAITSIPSRNYQAGLQVVVLSSPTEHLGGANVPDRANPPGFDTVAYIPARLASERVP